MKNSVLAKVVSLFVLLMSAVTVQASDTAKEKRWADQVLDTLMVGEEAWLKVGKHKILGLYTENEADKLKGGLIVLHGIGVHPNWADIVLPVRSELPASGWHTLSIQMPILVNEAKADEYIPLFPEVAPRIEAAVAFLKKKGIKNIVIVSHSLGARMAAYYLAAKPDASIKGLVAVGATGISKAGSGTNYVHSIKSVKIPVLEIYGSDDLEGVLSSIKQKAAAAKKAGNKHYKQVKVEGANHFFKGKSEELLKLVDDWIKQFAQ